MFHPKFKEPSAAFPSYVPERDFVGYGADSPKDCWPNGKKIYVSFVLNYEEGAEFTTWNGDQSSENGLHELSFNRPVRQNQRDLVVEDMFHYGIRAGLPRILKLFKKFDMPFTVWTCARALELSGGTYAKMMIEAGHEFACHGNHWRRHGFYNGPENDAKQVREGLDRFQKALGDPTVPAGWYIHSRSHAHKMVRAKVHEEKGVPLLYCSDCYAGDLPYYIPNPLSLEGAKDTGMLMIPYSLVNNDYRFIAKEFTGVGQSDDWFQTLKADFDYLYEEGKQGRPKTVAFHNRIIGKPSRIQALKRFMEYISTKEDVWVATRRDAAKHWREQFPYEVVGATRDLHQSTTHAAPSQNDHIANVDPVTEHDLHDIEATFETDEGEGWVATPTTVKHHPTGSGTATPSAPIPSDTAFLPVGEIPGVDPVTEHDLHGIEAAFETDAGEGWVE